MSRSFAFRLLAPAALLWLVSPVLAQHPEEHEHAVEHEQHENHENHGHAEHGENLHADGFHHDFSDAEHWARRFDAPERVDWQKPVEVMRVAGVEPGMTAVDLGAGTGFFLGYLSESVGADGHVVGLDVEETLVTHMRERAAEAGWENVDVRAVAPDDPGLEPASVDRVLIVNTWHHLDDRPSYAGHLLEALRPGGAVVIVDYTLDTEHGPPKAHRLAPNRVVLELEAGGFDAEIAEEDLPRQFVVIARRP